LGYKNRKREFLIIKRFKKASKSCFGHHSKNWQLVSKPITNKHRILATLKKRTREKGRKANWLNLAQNENPWK
jgi:hypothetical protein